MVISRLRMYLDLKRTCTAVVLPVKPFVFDVIVAVVEDEEKVASGEGLSLVPETIQMGPKKKARTSISHNRLLSIC